MTPRWRRRGEHMRARPLAVHWMTLTCMAGGNERRHQRSSCLIRGHRASSEVISTHLHGRRDVRARDGAERRCTQSAVVGTEERRGDEEVLDVIRGHQRSSEVIRGHQRSSEVIRGHQRSSEVHQRSSEVIRGHQRFIRGHQRSSEVIRGHSHLAQRSVA